MHQTYDTSCRCYSGLGMQINRATAYRSSACFGRAFLMLFVYQNVCTCICGLCVAYAILRRHHHWHSATELSVLCVGGGGEDVHCRRLLRRVLLPAGKLPRFTGTRPASSGCKRGNFHWHGTEMETTWSGASGGAQTEE